MLRRILGFSVLFIFTLACALVKPSTPTPTLPPPTATQETPTGEVPNPASAHCLEQGGVLELRQEQGGVVGYCRFADGSVCEEWAYYRGECKPGAAVTPEAWVTPPAEAVQGLLDAVAASQPAQAFDCGYRVLPLLAPPNQAPLWAVYSCGMVNWQLDPAPTHFLAIYTLRDRVWTELARMTFNDEVMFDFIPPDGSVQQVALDPEHVCIEMNGGVGAHGGSYAILRFDGQKLETLISNGADSMGAGYTTDLNQDGQLDVVLDWTNAYVFCYACGVRQVVYGVYTWDRNAQTLRKITLNPLGADYPEALRQQVNEAITLAKAGLWRDAQALIGELLTTPPTLSPAQLEELGWIRAYIDLYAQGKARAVTESGYPLLQNVYYGDYDAAVALMRSYTPQQIFDVNGPLIVGTPVEMSLEILAAEVTESANAALQVRPDLAAAYFLRGWVTYLTNPQSSAAREDVARAAQLAPSDPLYLACANYLR